MTGILIVTGLKPALFGLLQGRHSHCLTTPGILLQPTSKLLQLYAVYYDAGGCVK